MGQGRAAPAALLWGSSAWGAALQPSATQRGPAQPSSKRHERLDSHRIPPHTHPPTNPRCRLEYLVSVPAAVDEVEAAVQKHKCSVLEAFFEHVIKSWGGERGRLCSGSWRSFYTSVTVAAYSLCCECRPWVLIQPPPDFIVSAARGTNPAWVVLQASAPAASNRPCKHTPSLLRALQHHTPAPFTSRRQGGRPQGAG